MSNAFNLGPSFIAGETIPPRRFLKLSTSAARKVLKCNTTSPIIGVSGSGQKAPPGTTGADTAVHAESGDQMHDMRTMGDIVDVDVGSGGLTTGCPVGSDSVGLAIIATGTGQHYIGGYALDAYAEGEVGKVVLIPQQITL